MLDGQLYVQCGVDLASSHNFIQIICRSKFTSRQDVQSNWLLDNALQYDHMIKTAFDLRGMYYNKGLNFVKVFCK